MTLENYL